ncbi:hypothetical protein H6G65_13790 [Microcystis elabens FACHB-917]|nr:hypothetical protein [Microcystis elabens FACHB-917]
MWKLLPILRRHRPDLTILCLNAHTTGLLLIAGLDASDGAGSNADHNSALAAVYPDLVRHWRPIAEPPAEVLERHGAIPSNHPLVPELLQLLIQARQQRWSTPELRAALAPLQPRMTAAEHELAGRARALSQQPCPLPDPAPGPATA